ncbi:MAG: rhodanese-like domain-containing protein [Bacteroidia bacterium]|nr:rhodanese-like domain-containing protein [Bacteroidales bacterium]NCD40539.1 rhodanese-like domain-containing protein [Bacteroidia bacterium]MDD2321994.1 rhodanese-like domain-containing protein [Bacteroidales bacterium]MDD3010049.1 rhodanese-like domain-containing protein [Bacteroidales bacterium]MDD3960840.1 rhodanese-like domain-containing protein [Bacteroidales bacterium]
MKTNKITIAALSFLALVLLGFVSTTILTPKTPPGYIDGRIEFSKDHYFSLRELYQALNAPESPVMFIDLRHADRFEIHHIPGAVNMPVEKILCHKCIRQIRHANKPIVLVAETERAAVQGWIILRNAGFNDLNILAGGYDFARQNVIKSYKPKFNSYAEEKAKFDYPKYFSNTETSAPVPKPIMKTIQTTPAAGGC